MCLSLILGSIAFHTSNVFQPEGGYNLLTNSIGAELSQCVDKGIDHAVTAFTFKDSYDKPSKFAGYSLKYKNKYITPAIGLGYAKTSYYEGFVPVPYLEKELHKNLTVQTMYYPKTTKNDGVIALQLKWKF